MTSPTPNMVGQGMSHPVFAHSGGRVASDNVTDGSGSRWRSREAERPSDNDRPAADGRNRLPNAPSLVVARRLPFNEIELEFDEARGALWTWMAYKGRPSFTPPLMDDFEKLQSLISSEPHAGSGVRYNLLASREPGIFNLGGDLEVFARLIRAGDVEGIRHYADLAIKTMHGNGAQLRRADIVSISVVQGDALGGGFEAALSSNAIVAERGTKFGLPEMVFNLFPGMGAMSFLARKLGVGEAQRFIRGERTYAAEDLHDMGLVHVLADPGRGVAAAEAFLDELNGDPARRAVFAMEEAFDTYDYAEMHDIVMLWADAAMRLSTRDVKMMDRLVSAQYKRIGQAATTAA